MEWFKNLYLSQGLEGKQEELISAVEKGEPPVWLYAVTLSISSRDLLDIRRATSLKKLDDQKKLPMIVGLSRGKAQAIGITARMLEDCLADRGDTCLRDYLRSV